MKINFTLTKKTKKPKNLEHFSYASISPYKDWYLILMIFFVLNIAIVGFCAYYFFEVNSPMVIDETQAPAPTDEVGISRLQKTISAYEKKKEEHEKALQSRPDVVDPSL